jgi:starch phosphorylase
MSRKPSPVPDLLDALHYENSARAIRRDIISNLLTNLAKFPKVATKNDYYLALAYAVRDRLMRRWIQSAKTYFLKGSRTVIYLSAEYLMGPQLGNNLVNLGIYEQARRAVRDLGLSLETLLEHEEEPGLGNGGLGRLAACYMDSLATKCIPAIGYGIRYEFGIFDQAIENGWQVEKTDKWLRFGNPWEIAHPEIRYAVGFGGSTRMVGDNNGGFSVAWTPDRIILGTPFDTPVLGYEVENANVLRLWRAQAAESFDFEAFNVGDYYRAVEQMVASENITKVLYPNDEPEVGRKLRLMQQAFFVSCSLQDMLRIYFQREKNLAGFSKKFAVQLNDTHPALAVAELMRLMVDVYKADWESAWDITKNTFAFTNHTLLPEALETWPMRIFETLLPRHTEIIYEINRRFLDSVSIAFPDDPARIERLSLFEEDHEKRIRMAHLACVGSYAINGVAQLHTRLLKKTVLSDFYELYPEKFSNKTNGVTPRRFMLLANPYLSALITDAIGDGWVCDMDRLQELEPFAQDAAFCERWRKVKLACKRKLAQKAADETGVKIDPESLFDVHVKRIHEYKRQHLNVLHILGLYSRIKQGLEKDAPPRTFIFGGKSAPGYFMAKLIIKLIHSAADLVNRDPETAHLLKVVFLPDFNVKKAQDIYPAAELSEQISTAGKEASGTGNMKFSLNGALTIGTLDGANVEIRQAVGKENFFLFGLTAEEVAMHLEQGYRPRDILAQNPELSSILEMLGSAALCGSNRDLFRPLYDSLVSKDPYFVLADYPSYADKQREAGKTWTDKECWTQMSILNTARMGFFSSDRAIDQYCDEIWKVKPVKVKL